MCLDIYRLDPAHFLSTPGWAWQAALKKAKSKLDILTDTDMFLMKKILEVEYVMLSINKRNNKYMKDYDKNEESLYLNIGT